MHRLLFASLLLSPLALAGDVPLELSHQGRLFDTSGVALVGPHDLTLTLWDAPATGTLIWTEVYEDVEFDAGFYSLEFGQTTANELVVPDFLLPELYIGIAVDAGAELPRLHIVSVPYAVVSDTATNVEGGAVNATSIKINDTEVINASGELDWSKVTGKPKNIADFEALNCTDGDHAVFASGAWTCAANTSAFSDLTGSAAFGQLPTGTADDEVAIGSHGHTAAEVGAIPAAGGGFDGDVRLNPTGTATAFDDTHRSSELILEASTWDTDALAEEGVFFVHAKGLDCDAGECLGISPDAAPRAFEISGSDATGAENESIIEIRDGYGTGDNTTIFHGDVIIEGSVDSQGIDVYRAAGLYGQIVAQAACTAMNTDGGPTFAIQRTCSATAMTCTEVCASVGEVCFNSLHIYGSQPFSAVETKGLNTHRYNSCGGGCGPNFCCCE